MEAEKKKNPPSPWLLIWVGTWFVVAVFLMGHSLWQTPPPTSKAELKEAISGIGFDYEATNAANLDEATRLAKEKERRGGSESLINQAIAKMQIMEVRIKNPYEVHAFKQGQAEIEKQFEELLRLGKLTHKSFAHDVKRRSAAHIEWLFSFDPEHPTPDPDAK